jgi:hypothetical protein
LVLESLPVPASLDHWQRFAVGYRAGLLAIIDAKLPYPGKLMNKILRVALLFCVAWLLASCADFNPHESQDLDRHDYSNIRVSPQDNSILIYEVMLTAKYPDGDEQAEQIRMQWLETWLRLRQLCPESYKVLSRRRYQPSDLNLYHMDLRYEVTCDTPPPAES